MQRLGGRYRLESQLGVGGMSVVWRAYDEVLEREVAVKVLAAEFAGDAASRERIHAEAQAVARLAHPNITNVYDFGESPDRAGRPVPYIVMELLDGESLAQLLKSGPLDWRTALSICADVAAGLAAAHERGVVHQDVKPANAMLTSTGVKVVDFGIAAAAGSRDDGQLLGTMAYVAPERLLGGRVGPAADVYALGLLLYRCLTGELPWRAAGVSQVMSNHCYVTPRPLPVIEGLPEAIPELVIQCLAKRPAERPSSREVAQALATAAGARVVLPSIVAERTQGIRRAVPARRTAASARPRWVRLAMAGLTVLAVAGFATTCANRPSPDGGALADGPGAGAGGGGTAGDGRACQVRYVAGGETARMTVENTGHEIFTDWTMVFTLPGSEHYVAVEGAELVQPGTTVTLRAQGSLPPGQRATVRLTGARATSGLPKSFTLNGVRCRVLTGTTAPGQSVDDPNIPVTEPTPGDTPPGTSPPVPPGPSGGPAPPATSAPQPGPSPSQSSGTTSPTASPAPTSPDVSRPTRACPTPPPRKSSADLKPEECKR
ncbi:MAG TPA: protein kinase [Micromonosporaceae bacterium]|nr:protein kinase [Micromonosporaceae bacterium]